MTDLAKVEKLTFTALFFLTTSFSKESVAEVFHPSNTPTLCLADTGCIHRILRSTEIINDLCPFTDPALRFEVNIGLQIDFPLVQIGFNLYKSRALPVKCVLAVIYKTVSDFIHFSAKVRKD